MIVGTAGHIDHGKTSLVRALTGVDADRLQEEKARGITIDIGFAYMPGADGKVIGFVDVPGHERFVHNMLAGATGIDFALLVVAADDGVMPQTREHLAILDLLGIKRGIVALTKADLVAPDRLAAAHNEVANALLGTRLEGLDIIPTSAVTEMGVKELRGRLVEASRLQEHRQQEGAFRLAVDRSFTLAGTGTVVTGIVLSGSVSVGDQIVVSPKGISGRVRGLHAQNMKAERGTAGDRCALNLAGEAISKDAISRETWCWTHPSTGLATASMPSCGYLHQKQSLFRSGCRCVFIMPRWRSAQESCCWENSPLRRARKDSCSLCWSSPPRWHRAIASWCAIRAGSGPLAAASCATCARLPASDARRSAWRS